MTPFHGALRVSSFVALAFILTQAFFPAYAATYSMTLQTDAQSYSGVQPIVITGTISPVPGTNTAVIITLKNSAGGVADIAEVVPSLTDGSFGYTSYPGGNQAWTSGTFTVNATWGGSGATVSRVVTFTYLAAVSSTTSSSTSSSSSTTSSKSSSTTTSSSTSSRTSSSTSSSTTTSTSTTLLARTNSTSSASTSATTTTTTTTPAPEFPSSSLAILALVAAVTVAVLSGRFSLRPAGSVGR